MKLRQLKQNKGQVYFSALIALLVLPIVLLYAMHAVASTVEPFDTPIGRDSSSILAASHNVQNAMDYLKESAKYSAHQAMYDLGEKGGGSLCGSVSGYSYWSKACFPENYEKNFLFLFSSYLDDYIRNYPDLSFPLDNYNFVISGSNIIGIAKNQLTAYIGGSQSNNIGYYSLKPSFTIDIDYDIKNIYDKLKYFSLISEASASPSIVNYTLDCAKDDKKLMAACVSKAVAQMESIFPEYEISYNQIRVDIFSFEIITKRNIVAYSKDDMHARQRDIEVKFAIDFSHVNDLHPDVLGSPVEYIPITITSKSLDKDCPFVEVENIPDYITCTSENCKIGIKANTMIQDAQKYAAELYGYKLNISSAYRTYEQQEDYFDEFQGKMPVDKPTCQAPHVLGKSVILGFEGIDMGEAPLSDFSHPERQKLKKVMETAGWVSHDEDYRRYECCETLLYLEKKYKDIDFKDISNVPFTFVAGTKEPGLGEKKGLVYLHDVWDIAKKENVNYHLVLAIIATESNFVNINEKNDKKAHGLMQMFKGAVSDIYSELKPNYSKLKTLNSDYVQEYILTSTQRDDVKIQIHAGTLYIKKINTYLAKGKKPTDAPTIIQAYHDGAGSITKDGGTKICDIKGHESQECKESKTYLAKVSGHYDGFIDAYPIV